MKKILASLSIVIISAPTSLSNMSFIKNISSNQFDQDLNYSTDSFTNIIKIINSKYDNSKNMENPKIDELLSKIIPTYYYETVNEKSGEVLAWESHSTGKENVIKEYHQEYINKSNFEVIRPTYSRTKKVIDSHTFDISLSENIAYEYSEEVTGTIGVPFDNIIETMTFKFGGELGSVQHWSDFTSEEATETIPAHEIPQGPNSKLTIDYVISQDIIKFDGIAKFKIKDLFSSDFRIPFIYFDQNGDFDYMVWNKYSLREIIDILKEMGFENELLDSDENHDYSVLTVDNIEQPKKANLNLPLTWTATTENFKLVNMEEPLEK